MAAVDATEVTAWSLAMSLGHAVESIQPPKAGPGTRNLAHSALAALFDRAGIDGPGTIALTRDDEGRVGLGVVMPHLAVVPVEDGEEGQT